MLLHDTSDDVKCTHVNKNGTFCLFGLPPGQYSLSIHRTRFEKWETTLDLRRNEQLDLNIALRPLRETTENHKPLPGL